ncbi:MAG: hypothetical protein PHQ35_06065 [Phycisphaerae bacterium]|nr:hypothetical protein [Phycisphaerae bacterium]MDD5381256.1 hypothetical protein [Phycisphaerae bacterium]
MKNTNRKGSALFVVLLIVMAITILSLSFLSRSDVELACGENMILRTQMDYLAESGLEYARGLILNDNTYLGNWAVTGQQLTGGSEDFYDVSVAQDANGECNYQIICDAYREKNGERIGRSRLEAELRLDPCIAFWVEKGILIVPNVTINGDVYCNGTLANSGTIYGDVFANGLAGGGILTGRLKARGDLSLTWPQVAAGDFTSHYSVQTIDANTLDSNSLGGSSQVCYYYGNLELASNVQIEGMLIVEGNLTITGNGNVITAGENLPAMLVTGNVIVATDGYLRVNGLAIVNVRLANSGDVNITGGLFLKDLLTGAGRMVITAAPSKTEITTWPSVDPVRWSPVAGAFFKSIARP